MVVVLGLVVGYATLDKETRGVITNLPTNTDVLFWSIPQRDAAFRALDRLSFLANSNVITKRSKPYPLLAGPPITIPGQHAKFDVRGFERSDGGECKTPRTAPNP